MGTDEMCGAEMQRHWERIVQREHSRPHGRLYHAWHTRRRHRCRHCRCQVSWQTPWRAHHLCAHIERDGASVASSSGSDTQLTLSETTPPWPRQRSHRQRRLRALCDHGVELRVHGEAMTVHETDGARRQCRERHLTSDDLALSPRHQHTHTKHRSTRSKDCAQIAELDRAHWQPRQRLA